MEAKKNVPLFVALSIPVLMIVLVAVSIYLPAMFIKPQTDFIYIVEGDFYCGGTTYLTQMGRVVETQVKTNTNNKICNEQYRVKSNTRLFYYDVKEDVSQEISYEKAAGFMIDDMTRSADGFEVVSGSYGGDIFSFGGGDYYSRYRKKGSYSRRINAVVGQSHSYKFKFLGWVKGADQNG